MTRTMPATRPRPWSRAAWTAVLLICSGVVGCGPEVETTYGRSRGQSINGTNAFNAMIRARGHTTRTAVRYTDVLGEWARTIIRFAPEPGPPEQEEAAWLREWLGADPGRKLIYIPADAKTDVEFWTAMLAALPKDTAEADRFRVQSRLDESVKTAQTTTKRTHPPAESKEWFATEPTNPKKPTDLLVPKGLDGPWAEDLDTKAAALPIHEAIRAENDEQVLLSGDGKKMVISWTFGNENAPEGDVLVIANGAALLNAGLLNHARRPLAARVVDWIGDDTGNVAFVEGWNVMMDGDSMLSPFQLLTVDPFNWVTVHLGVFGLLLCLSLAATIGRPRPEPVASIERPSAHPIALGAILARTRQVAVAQEMLDAYQRWRHPSALTKRPESNPPSPRRVPRA